MTYRNGYRGSSRRGYGSRSFTPGRVGKPNRRPGACKACGEDVPAGAGQLWREESGDWSVVHVERTWAGSPVSGQYTGGCPGETDRMNAEGKFGAEGGARSEAERIASAAAIHAASNPAPAPRKTYAYTSPGARLTSRQGRCEDAPCCGCCD